MRGRRARHRGKLAVSLRRSADGRARRAADAGSAMNQSRPLHVLIAGGGVAGLETLLALRALAGRRVSVTLLAPAAEFVVPALTVGEPFDRAQGRRLVLAEVAAEQRARLVAGRLSAVEADSHTAITE